MMCVIVINTYAICTASKFESSWSKVAQQLVNRAKPNDIIMTLGAGDIGLLAPEVLTLLEARQKS